MNGGWGEGGERERKERGEGKRGDRDSEFPICSNFQECKTPVNILMPSIYIITLSVTEY